MSCALSYRFRRPLPNLKVTWELGNLVTAIFSTSERELTECLLLLLNDGSVFNIRRVSFQAVSSADELAANDAHLSVTWIEHLSRAPAVSWAKMTRIFAVELETAHENYKVLDVGTTFNLMTPRPDRVLNGDAFSLRLFMPGNLCSNRVPFFRSDLPNSSRLRYWVKKRRRKNPKKGRSHLLYVLWRFDSGSPQDIDSDFKNNRVSFQVIPTKQANLGHKIMIN